MRLARVIFVDFLARRRESSPELTITKGEGEKILFFQKLNRVLSLVSSFFPIPVVIIISFFFPPSDHIRHSDGGPFSRACQPTNQRVHDHKRQCGPASPPTRAGSSLPSGGVHTNIICDYLGSFLGGIEFFSLWSFNHELLA